MLLNFFSINLPYGIRKNDQEDWFAFNREHLPLGMTDNMPSLDLDFGVSYKNVTEDKLEKMISLCEMGDYTLTPGKGITEFMFYNDMTDPLKNAPKTLKYWDAYFNIIRELSTWETN